MRILVIGCGVIGLTTAVYLQEMGYQIQIWTREVPPATTSDVAGAFWYPHKAGDGERVTAWGATTFHVFKQLSSIPDAGVAMRKIVELLAIPDKQDPDWSRAVEDFQHVDTRILPAGYVDGYTFSAPVINMTVYLPYLMKRYIFNGGTISRRDALTISEAAAHCSVVVNCSGLGARELVGDPHLYGSRGQVVRVRSKRFHQVLLDGRGPNSVAYIIPHDDGTVVLGGTDEPHRESTEVDPTDTQAIMQRCSYLAPEVADLAEADIVSVSCGLRPVREVAPGQFEVRLEAEQLDLEHRLIHNYGHGGAGVTLSWGCAASVGALV